MTSSIFLGDLQLSASQGLTEADLVNSVGGGAPTGILSSQYYDDVQTTGDLQLEQFVSVTFPSGGVVGDAQYNVLDYDGNSLSVIAGEQCLGQSSPTTAISVAQMPPTLPGGSLFESPEPPTVVTPGEGQDIQVGMGAIAFDVNILNAGTMSLFIGAPTNSLPAVPPGYQFATGQAPFLLQIGDQGGGLSQTPTVVFPFVLNLPIDNSLTSGQLQFVEADLIDPETNALLPGTLVSVTGDPMGAFTVTTAAPAQQFSVFAPQAAHPAIVATAGAKLLYDGTADPGLTFSTADPTAQPLAAIIASATAQGLVLAGPVLQIANPASNLNFPAALTLPPAFRSGLRSINSRPDSPRRKSAACSTASSTTPWPSR